MDPSYAVARQYVREVQTKLAAVAGDGRRIYDEFSRTLMQFRRRNIDASVAISTVEKLFRNHPDLLDAFKAFVPSNRSAAAPPETVYSDFLKRVWRRFRGGGAYSKFSGCMHAYARGEINASDVCDEVVGLLGENDDLVEEFMIFAPESFRERSKKRKKTVDGADLGQEFGMESEKKKRERDLNGEITASPPRRTARRRIGKSEEKAAKRIVDQENDMEDLLCEIDVKIGNFESTSRSVCHLLRRLAEGQTSAAELRLDEHFTPLNLAHIGNLDRKLLEGIDQDPVRALLELMEILMVKKEALVKERVKIVQKWHKIRNS